MPVRNGHRPGRHLMTDDESGFVYYDDVMVQRWDGMWVHKSNNETRHPQEFVKALNDPYPLKNVRPDGFAASIDNTFDLTVGETSVSRKNNGPADHLFTPGIGKLIIEGTNLLTQFRVR